MLIDWFTIAAQGINFLVLVWLLKRFLYKPILDAIDARELRISTELADAAAKQTDADKERAEYLAKNADFESQREELMATAVAAAEAERQRLVDGARQDAEKLRVERHGLLRSEFKALNNEITQRSRDEVLAIARKVLGDLADASLEEKMVHVFVARLRSLDHDSKTALDQTVSSQGLRVRTAFELTPEDRAMLQQAISDTFGEVPLEFEVISTVVGGVELVSDGHKMAWSISEYLSELEGRIASILAEQPPTEAGGTESLQ